MSKVDQMTSKARLLEPLTSFRFIAALMVYQQHAYILNGMLGRYGLGTDGVGFFFILSGFILTYVYTSRLASGNWTKIKSFYAARIAKIYPVHLLTFLMAFTLGIGVIGWQYHTHIFATTLAIAFANLALVQSYFPSDYIHFSFNGVAWSISDEMFFYALFPWIIYMIVRYRKTLTLPRLTIAWTVAWALLLLFLGTREHVTDAWVYDILPPLRLFDFMSGMLLGLIYLQLTQRSESIFDRIQRRYFTALEFVSICLLIVGISLLPEVPQGWQSGMFLLPFWGLIIFTFAWQKGLLSRIMSTKPLVFLGNISFSFYMVHQLVLRSVAQTSIAPAQFGHHALVSFVLSLGIATAIYITFEEPNRIRLKSYLEQLTMSAFLKQKLRLHSPFPSPIPEQQPTPVLEIVEVTPSSD